MIFAWHHPAAALVLLAAVGAVAGAARAWRQLGRIELTNLTEDA